MNFKFSLKDIFTNATLVLLVILQFMNMSKQEQTEFIEVSIKTLDSLSKTKDTVKTAITTDTFQISDSIVRDGVVLKFEVQK